MAIYINVDNDNLEKALKKYKKELKKTGLMLEIFKRQEFTKPSAVKRQKKLKSIIRNKYKVKKEQEIFG